MIWHCGKHRLKWGVPLSPLIMGVINVTPDSFSDGGVYFSTDKAVKQGMSLLEEGADIIDVGAESTRPGARPVAEEEEKRRLLPVVEALAAAGAVVSADTMKAGVMRAAAAAGAAIINDVNGFRGDGAVAAAAASDCGLVVVHMRGQPRTMQQAPQYADVVTDVGNFLHKRTATLMKAGVVANRICWDPGIGFGKTAEHNAALLRRRLGTDYPRLIGVSRKSLFVDITGDRPATDRDAASSVAAALLAASGTDVLRVHNVRMTKEALMTARLLSNAA